ncbi:MULTISPECIES: sensor histidine kinase [unclassified Variovorax]|uniref:sensor histidine kinase n=1 Tax=unclassified Variovorax TaxID=663243 RepID=UPI003F4594B6
MKAMLRDTLAKRLFLLMWVALVVSHLAGYLSVHAIYVPSDRASSFGAASALPSLPPTPGVPDARAAQDAAPFEGAVLPLQGLLLDYGLRIAVIALAAWLGSRWLSKPMRDLVAASQSLGHSVTGGRRPAVLDDSGGTREVRDAARVFNAMARRLHEQFRTRDLMVAAMSHDLRTPLTRLRMRLDAMDGASNPALRERAVDDIREMDRLIDTVLGVFRGDVLGTPEALQDTDVAALVQSLADDMAEQGQAVRVAGESHGGTAEVVRAEPAALRRVIGNLVGNAVRYAGAAELSVHTAPHQIRIVVDDRGPGIPPAHLETVFEPFFRVEPSRNRDTGGTGLGLHIARELALRQGAQVVLSNRPEGGLRAEVVFARQ